MTKRKQIQDQGEPGTHAAEADGAAPAVPRRLVELDYIAAVADVVSLEDWNQIVRAAVYLAKAGDFRARDWVAAYLTGGKELLGLAAAEFNGDTPDAAVRAPPPRSAKETASTICWKAFSGALNNASASRQPGPHRIELLAPRPPCLSRRGGHWRATS